MDVKPGQKVWVRYDMACQIAEKISEDTVYWVEKPFIQLKSNMQLVSSGQLFESRNDALKSLIKNLEQLIE